VNRLGLIAFSIATLVACGRGRLIGAQPVPFDATRCRTAIRGRLYATQRARPGTFLLPGIRRVMAMVVRGRAWRTAAEMTKGRLSAIRART
jgi:hypothetical protein